MRFPRAKSSKSFGFVRKTHLSHICAWNSSYSTSCFSGSSYGKWSVVVRINHSFFSFFLENGKWGCFRSGFFPPLSKRCQSPSSGNGSLFFNEKEMCSVQKTKLFLLSSLLHIPKEGGIYDALQAHPFPIYLCYAHFLFTSKKHSFLRFGIRRKLFRPLPAPPHVKL